MAYNIKRETMKHRTAFEYYYSLGDNRTYKAVASKFNCTEQAVYLWANSFNWEDRVLERDIQNTKKLIKATDKQILQDKLEYRQLIKDTLSEFYKKQLKDKKLPKIKIKDAVELMKFDVDLMKLLDHGTVDSILKTDNNKNSNSSSDSEETINTLNSLYKILKEKADDKE